MKGQKMRRIIQNTIIAGTFVFLFAGWFMYIGQKETDATEANTMELTVSNVSPFDVENVKVEVNGDHPVKIERLGSGETVEIQVRKDLNPAGVVRVYGEAGILGEFGKCFGGQMRTGTEFGISMNENMKMEVSSNLPEYVSVGL